MATQVWARCGQYFRAQKTFNAKTFQKICFKNDKLLLCANRHWMLHCRDYTHLLEYFSDSSFRSGRGLLLLRLVADYKSKSRLNSTTLGSSSKILYNSIFVGVCIYASNVCRTLVKSCQCWKITTTTRKSTFLT